MAQMIWNKLCASDFSLKYMKYEKTKEIFFIYTFLQNKMIHNYFQFFKVWTKNVDRILLCFTVYLVFDWLHLKICKINTIKKQWLLGNHVFADIWSLWSLGIKVDTCNFCLKLVFNNCWRSPNRFYSLGIK